MRKILNPLFGILANGIALGCDIERAVLYGGKTLSWLFSGLAGLNGACVLLCLVWFIINEVELRAEFGDYARGAKSDIVDL